MDYQELELKYFVGDLKRIEEKLIASGALCTQARVLEINLRFDTHDGALTGAGRALRLRQDSRARLTYKGPSESIDGARLRQEIEFEVDNFQAARDFLLALGYQVIVMYEKYRAQYDLGAVHIMLDELPYGNFVEIEGPDPAQLQEVNSKLELTWDTRIPESYTVLFDQLRQKMQLNFRDLAFENFQGLHITSADLGVLPADQ